MVVMLVWLMLVRLLLLPRMMMMMLFFSRAQPLSGGNAPSMCVVRHATFT